MVTIKSKRTYLSGLWLVCLVLLGTGTYSQQPLKFRDFLGTTVQDGTAIREALVDTIESQLYVREATGNNDGPDVEKYLRSVGLGKGYAWCAAFVSWNLSVNNIENPNTAWSPSFGLSNVIYKKGGIMDNKLQVKPGMVFTLYYSNLKRIGHVGFIIREDKNNYYTIEGNTNGQGSREGDGVYRKIRKKSYVYTISEFIVD